MKQVISICCKQPLPRDVQCQGIRWRMDHHAVCIAAPALHSAHNTPTDSLRLWECTRPNNN